MQQLSTQDAQFLYIETGNNLTHVMGVNIFDPSTAPGGRVRFKDIIAHVEGRLDWSPVFRRRLMRLPYDFDLPYWVDDTGACPSRATGGSFAFTCPATSAGRWT